MLNFYTIIIIPIMSKRTLSFEVQDRVSWKFPSAQFLMTGIVLKLYMIIIVAIMLKCRLFVKVQDRVSWRLPSTHVFFLPRPSAVRPPSAARRRPPARPPGFNSSSTYKSKLSLQVPHDHDASYHVEVQHDHHATYHVEVQAIITSSG